MLLEDSGALIGLFLALFGVVMAKITGNGRWDALGSLSIGVLLCVIAIFLAVEMKGLLIGESASPEMERQIVDALTDHDQVNTLIHLRTEHLGPDELLVGGQGRLRPLPHRCTSSRRPSTRRRPASARPCPRRA